MVDTHHQNQKYHFIHIPKNAGTSIVKSLNRDVVSYLGHPGIQQLSKSMIPHDVKCFAVIRNPFSRLLSWFMYHKGSGNVNAKHLRHYLETESFKQWVIEKNCFHSDEPQINGYTCWLPDGVTDLYCQNNWIKNTAGITCKILRYENLDEEWEKFRNEIQSEKLKIANKTTIQQGINYNKDDWRSHYDQETIDYVSNMPGVKEDMETFNYTFEED